jgi:hypothetical protein
MQRNAGCWNASPNSLRPRAVRINVVDSLRSANHRLQRENKALLAQPDALRATARESNALVVAAGHDLLRVWQSKMHARS